jgi:hypothetical protein
VRVVIAELTGSSRGSTPGSCRWNSHHTSLALTSHAAALKLAELSDGLVRG